MVVDRQPDVAHKKGAGIQELAPVPQEVTNGEVSGEQEMPPAPQYNIPHPYSVDAFRQLPFRRQKECALRCRKTLDTDAFGEAKPLSEVSKKSLQMQMDEFDRERRWRTSNAQEAPPQKTKTPYRKPSSWQSRDRSRHAPSQDFQGPVVPPPPPPPAIVSRLREPIVFPCLPINAPCVPATPPPTPPPAASDGLLREGLDVKVIKNLLREKADSWTQKAIAANAKKTSLQGQSEAAYAHARKAEIARAALDRPDDIIIEMIEEKVDSLRKEAETLKDDSKIAEAEARQFFAQASATQGTVDRYQPATAAPHQQNHGPLQEDRRPHPDHHGKLHGGKGSKVWNRR
jgi:hypothetical protein